jgi:hypothetical protein
MTTCLLGVSKRMKNCLLALGICPFIYGTSGGAWMHMTTCTRRDERHMRTVWELGACGAPRPAGLNFSPRWIAEGWLIADLWMLSIMPSHVDGFGGGATTARSEVGHQPSSIVFLNGI